MENVFRRLTCLDRHSTYPQGDRSILPAVFAWIAFLTTTLAFDFFNWSLSPRNFVCYIGPSLENDILCVPLAFNDPVSYEADSYYRPSSDEWVASKAAAFFGLLSCLVGVAAAAKLSMGACFVLGKSQCRTIVALQVAAMITAFLTLVALAQDQDAVCEVLKRRYGQNSAVNEFDVFDETSCNIQVRVKLDFGAVCMIVGALLHGFGVRLVCDEVVNTNARRATTVLLLSAKQRPQVLRTYEKHPILSLSRTFFNQKVSYSASCGYQRSTLRYLLIYSIHKLKTLEAR